VVKTEVIRLSMGYSYNTQSTPEWIYIVHVVQNMSTYEAKLKRLCRQRCSDHRVLSIYHDRAYNQF